MAKYGQDSSGRRYSKGYAMQARYAMKRARAARNRMLENATLYPADDILVTSPRDRMVREVRWARYCWFNFRTSRRAYRLSEQGDYEAGTAALNLPNPFAVKEA